MKIRELYEKAIEVWGIHAQLDMVQEECAELIVAVGHLKRDRKLPEFVADEVADVEIMCGQMRVILGDRLVDEAVARKLKRLEGRLEEERINR